MYSRPLKLLLIEDSPDDADLLLLALAEGGWDLQERVVDNERALADALARQHWDVVISDHNLPGFSSGEALCLARESDPSVPFIIVSGCIGEDAAVEAMKAGADDYVMKDAPGRLLPAVERALREGCIRRERRAALRAQAENEARLRLITDNVPCILAELHVTGEQLPRVDYASAGSAELPGLDGEQLASSPGMLLDTLGLDEQTQRGLFCGTADTVYWEGQVPGSAHATGWFELRARRRGVTGESALWDCAVFNVSRQKSVELEVREVNRRLRELGSRLNATREAERSRIAREVHDDLGGSLTALKIDLVRRMERDGDADGQLARMIALVDDTVKAVRRICADLHPRILDDLGLLAAVEWQLERFGERTGLAWHLESAVEELVLERERALAVFRVFQEALTNVARHSQADSVWVSIRGDEQRLYLEVSDNGCGISAERMANTESFGIMGMQERIREVGGCVNFKTDTGQGTRVGVELPCIP